VTGLGGFTVTAAWRNDGAADLGLTHDRCGEWLDDPVPGMTADPVHDRPFEGRAPLGALVAAAGAHRCPA